MFRLSALFFPNNMERFKRLLLELIIFSIHQKTTKKKRSIKLLQFIMTPTREKSLWLLTQKWNDGSYLQKNQGL